MDKYNNHMIVWLPLAPSSTTSAPRVDRALPSVKYEWLSFQYLFIIRNVFIPSCGG